jgi:hypothetical protein
MHFDMLRLVFSRASQWQRTDTRGKWSAAMLASYCWTVKRDARKFGPSSKQKAPCLIYILVPYSNEIKIFETRANP